MGEGWDLSLVWALVLANKTVSSLLCAFLLDLALVLA